MAKTLNRNEIMSIADSLLDLKRQIDEGRLDATTAMRYRIDGAIVALDLVLGKSAEAIVELILWVDGDTS
jgi:hypothetical protein